VLWLCAQSVKTKSAAAEIDRDARKASDGEARKSGAGGERGKSTFEMADVVNPAIVDLESEESAARAKHAEGFGKGEVLQLARLEMVEDENRNGGREGLAGERQMRGITAEHSAGMSVVMSFQFAGGIVVIFQRRNTRDAFAEMHGGRTIAGANL
jgi:hypothetical protein